MNAPWYLDEGVPTLNHQRPQQAEEVAQRSSLDTWYARGQKRGPAATVYRKGACSNCGAMTHVLKDCLERPRRKGAKYTGEHIQADELVQDIQLDFEAKRDRCIPPPIRFMR